MHVLHADAWIAYLPRFSWLQSLVLGTRPDCPSANITGPKITFSTFWNSQIHRNTKLRGTMPVVPCQCYPKCCWHTQCLYTHSTFFHRLSYQFNQEMKNKHDFCTAVFVFDKWFIWWEVWSRPCLQYLFQAAADSSRSLNTCSSLFSSPVNCTSVSGTTICLRVYLYLQSVWVCRFWSILISWISLVKLCSYLHSFTIKWHWIWNL